jgi:hypothetical protein
MAFHTPQIICGCGEVYPLDVRDNVEFLRTCLRCGSEFHIKATIPVEFISGDPSRRGKLSDGEA